MSTGSSRPSGGRGRRGIFRRAAREPVPAGSGTRDFDPWPGPWFDGGDDGSAGVREPRRPRPLGPMSGAAALPEPVPPTMITLPEITLPEITLPQIALPDPRR